MTFRELNELDQKLWDEGVLSWGEMIDALNTLRESMRLLRELSHASRDYRWTQKLRISHELAGREVDAVLRKLSGLDLPPYPGQHGPRTPVSPV